MAQPFEQVQAQFAPPAESKRSQHQRILAEIERTGFITKWGAIYNINIHCSKLSTRIGEIEDRCGHKFKREKMYQVDSNGKRYFTGLKYSVPEGLTINDFKSQGL